MTSQTIPVEPFDFVIFGGTGDLSSRKLLPSLYLRDRAGQIPAESRIIGVSREALSHKQFREKAAAALKAHLPGKAVCSDTSARFQERLYYHHLDVLTPDGWAEFADTLNAAPSRIRSFYLATAPRLFGDIAKSLGDHGLVCDGCRVVLEKPLGSDLKTANEINDAVGQIFSEDQIFRIDHYLGKETVQNLMALRFANALFEPLWNSAHIDHVQITVAESLGVGSRGGYYDHAGALRDMVQNHLIQLICLTAMEPPSEFEADAVRDEKLKILRALRPIDEASIEAVTVRGQYKSGAVDGKAVPGYVEEISGEESGTETFVALKCEIDNWRWAGVPFYLRTGKRLPARVSEIVIAFKDVPHSIFGKSAGTVAANRLIIRLQPDEGVKLSLMIKEPGPGGMRLVEVPLDMTFAETFDVRQPDAYERLIMDVVRGNLTLFMRRDEVEAAWRWIDPIRAGWEAQGVKPHGYAAGTWGPTASIALIERDGRTWHEDEMA
ncbi:MAG: glucose-6-phosphate dehydrogenase [Pseudomonadota bacterium]